MKKDLVKKKDGKLYVGMGISLEKFERRLPTGGSYTDYKIINHTLSNKKEVKR